MGRGHCHWGDAPAVWRQGRAGRGPIGEELPYVDAARAIGASHLRIILQHITPQCVASYLVLITTQLGVAIVIEASLGFLGVGIPPPTPTWGNMMGGASPMSSFPTGRSWCSLGSPSLWWCWRSTFSGTPSGTPVTHGSAIVRPS